MNKILTIATATFALATAGHAATMKAGEAGAADPMMMIDTPTFVKTVKSSDQFEIKSSEMALQKAGSDDVKTFADQMIADHTKASKELMEVAKQTDGAMMTLAPKHALMLKQLDEASGADFDALYIGMQAGAHMEAVTLFRTYGKSGDDDAVTAFAKKTLPTLEMHLDHVKTMVAAQP